MLGILYAAGGDGASSTQIPVAAGRAASDLSNGARFAAGDATAAVVRVWSRHEWERLPAEAKPPAAQPTPDGRHVVALDYVER